MDSAGGRRLRWPQGVSPHPVYTYNFSQWLKQTLTEVLLGRDFIDIIQVQIGVDLKIRRLSGCSQPNWVSPQKGRGSSWGERFETWKGFDGREILHCWLWRQGEPCGKEGGRPWEQKAAPADSQQGNGDLSPTTTENWILLSACKRMLISSWQRGLTLILGRFLAENPVTPCAQTSDLKNCELMNGWFKPLTCGDPLQSNRKTSAASPHSASMCPACTQHLGHTNHLLSIHDKILTSHCWCYA